MVMICCIYKSELILIKGDSQIMQFIFPCDYFDKKKPDEIYQLQYDALKENGNSVSVVDIDNLDGIDIFSIPIKAQKVIYRGWMLNKEKYIALVRNIKKAKAEPITSVREYLSSHHLPNWYPLLKEYTPETIIFSEYVDLEKELGILGWDAFFIKDYVKSLKTSIGSIIQKPESIKMIISEMKKFRGDIEGGICVRRVENFYSETEKRYFVIFGKSFSSDPNEKIPTIVEECAKRIESKFFSVDTIIRVDGVQRIVEIGDGQVSDIVGWSPERFAEIWK